MSKFRKRPVIIDAYQFTGETDTPGICCKPDWGGENYSSLPHIHTLEGDMWVVPGDWIIKGVQGEYYACKDTIFQLTYEVA